MSNSYPTSKAAGDRETGTACPACQVKVRRGEDIVVCQACGSVHHPLCWDDAGGCGSYTCAPARRDPTTSDAAVWRIKMEDLDKAPLLPVYRAVAPPIPVPRTQLPRTSRLAIAAFITGVAGIPFFGVLTGLVAILLGSLAIGALRDTGRKGNGLAVAGILLGLLDVVGWIVFLGYFYVQHGQNLQFERFQPDLGALQNLPPAINRAMPANILIETRDGPLGKPTGLGSGIIMKITGGEAIILTNRHVVDIEFALNPQAPLGDKAEKISLDVTLVDQSVQPGKVIWMAPGGIDFALVRIHGVTAEARAALWKIDRGSRVGDQVFAIGNPHGLGWTHTQGAISQFRIQDLGEKRLRVIQTQTALNPGNSGGGLYDQEGYLLGVNTWAKDKQVAEGLNFAIALDALKTVSPPGLNLQAGSEGQDKP